MIYEPLEHEEIPYCDGCNLPLSDGGTYIRWNLKRLSLHLHAPCAQRLSNGLKSNLFNLYRRTEYRDHPGHAASADRLEHLKERHNNNAQTS